jgi:mono/diheme cytochrome c family protein
VERERRISPNGGRARFAPGLILAASLLVPACGGSEAGPPGDAPEAAAARGKRIYGIHCTACHNVDPARAGALGPAVQGSSRALLEARILRGEYPPGYAAKRDTQLMPAQPHLATKIDDLAAYLK